MLELSVHNRTETYRVNPTKIVALGLNYRDHIAESHSVKVRGFTREVPTEPILFPQNTQRPRRTGRTHRDSEVPRRLRL